MSDACERELEIDAIEDGFGKYVKERGRYGMMTLKPKLRPAVPMGRLLLTLSPARTIQMWTIQISVTMQPKTRTVLYIS